MVSRPCWHSFSPSFAIPVACGHFAQHVFKVRGQRVGQQALAPTGGQHFKLQKTLAARQIDLIHQLLGPQGDPGSGGRHGERGRAAFEVFLCVKGDVL